MKTKKTTQSPASIYRNQNALLRTLFERAADPRKVLCVALDYAKRKHVALCCDGNGEILRAPFAVDNTVEGVAFLIEQISATARRRKIPQCDIFLGGEDEASYVANFTAALRARQYLVLRVNAAEAKENRENQIASTDLLDLLGIAKTLLSRRARSTGPLGLKDKKATQDIYFEIREITRCRRTLVRQQTAASNRIHAYVDQLFPGFLEHSKSGLTPFCEASIALMRERFNVPEIARRRPRTLATFLARHGVHQPCGRRKAHRPSLKCIAARPSPAGCAPTHALRHRGLASMPHPQCQRTALPGRHSSRIHSLRHAHQHLRHRIYSRRRNGWRTWRSLTSPRGGLSLCFRRHCPTHLPKRRP